jgi:hypothetical protein
VRRERLAAACTWKADIRLCKLGLRPRRQKEACKTHGEEVSRQPLLFFGVDRESAVGVDGLTADAHNRVGGERVTSRAKALSEPYKEA